MNYSNLECFNLYNCYIQNNRNTTRAIQQYENSYPELPTPHRTIFLRLERNLRDFGAFKPKRSKYGSQINQNQIINEITEDPSISIREIESNTGLPKSSIQRFLKSNKYHPFKPTLVHHLKPEDYPRRLEFCEWFQNQCNLNPNFPLNVCWSDETRFTNNGIFNKHNEHYWALENPHIIRQTRFQEKFGFNVWCGILGK